MTGYLQARILRIAEMAWADFSVAACARSFVSDYAARLGAGMDIHRVGEISAYYRVSLDQYVASPTNWPEYSASRVFLLRPRARIRFQRARRRNVGEE